MRSNVSDTVEHADDRVLRSEAGTECQLQPRAAGEAEGGEEGHEGVLFVSPLPTAGFLSEHRFLSLLFAPQAGGRQI